MLQISTGTWQRAVRFADTEGQFPAPFVLGRLILEI